MTTNVQSGKLYVVRNSATTKEAGGLLEGWKLSAEGVFLTVPIAECSFWAKVMAIYHGPELSSEQTARIIARRWAAPVVLEPDLRELRVASWLDQPRFAQLIGDHLQRRVKHHMFEDVERAERRVAECIRRLAALHAGQSFAVVAQGRIITALYSYLLGRQLGKAEWLSLRSPDLSVIDLATWQVERGFFSQLQGTNDGRTEQ